MLKKGNLSLSWRYWPVWSEVVVRRDRQKSEAFDRQMECFTVANLRRVDPTEWKQKQITTTYFLAINPVRLLAFSKIWQLIGTKTRTYIEYVMIKLLQHISRPYF